MSCCSLCLSLRVSMCVYVCVCVCVCYCLLICLNLPVLHLPVCLPAIYLLLTWDTPVCYNMAATVKLYSITRFLVLFATGVYYFPLLAVFWCSVFKLLYLYCIDVLKLSAVHCIYYLGSNVHYTYMWYNVFQRLHCVTLCLHYLYFIVLKLLSLHSTYIACTL